MKLEAPEEHAFRASSNEGDFYETKDSLDNFGGSHVFSRSGIDAVSNAQTNPKPAEGFVGMEIQDTYHSEKETAGKAILAACTGLRESDSIPLGQYQGFSMALLYDAAHADYKLTLKGTLSHTTSLGADVFGNITRLDNLVDGLAKELEAYREALQDTRNQLENAKVELETLFAKEKELAEKSKRLKELNILLNMDQTEKMLLDDVLDEKSFENKMQHDIQR